MENMTKMYAKFLNAVAKCNDKESITRRFNRMFVKVSFGSEERKFNEEFLERLFKRKKIN